MPKTMNDLREVLFDTLADLRNKDKPMEIERAAAISQIAGNLIESAKVECKYVDLVGGQAASGFIETTTAAGGAPVNSSRQLPSRSGRS